MKLVIIAQPRSRSTWLMNQLRTSPHLSVVDDFFGELVTPGHRKATAKRMGLPIPEDSENWSMDFAYADLFWKNNPNGCFKLLAHGNSAAFYKHLMTLPDVYFATIQRTDILNSIAARIACAIKFNFEKDQTAYTLPTRNRKISYMDNAALLVPETIDFKRARVLEFFYYQLEGKGQRWLAEFANHERCVADIHDTHEMSKLEAFTESTFDWESLKPVSTYPEIFTDWEMYEKDVRDILGIG